MKVAIVCGAPSSEMLAPFDDPEWSIWVLGNRLNRYEGKRVNCVFEIHNDLSEHLDPQQYAEWLSEQTKTRGAGLVVGEGFPVSEEHIAPFSYEASECLYGSLYLTASPAYMISHAICEAQNAELPLELGIYGVDLAVDDHEYFWQRPCVEAWIGFARGRSIKVTIPEVSSLGRSDYIEGRDWDGKKNHYNKRLSSKVPFTQSEFDNMAAIHAQKIAQLQADIQTHSGAMQAYERLAKVARATEAGQDIKNLTDSFKTK